MENASKALIIAGGMLLVILVLTLAVFLFDRMGSSAKRQYEEFNEQSIAEFNQKFFNYENKSSIKTYDIVSIINLAKDCNKSEIYPVEVKVYFKGIEWQNQTNANIIALLSDENEYKCELEFADNSKYIGIVNITN